MEHRPPKKLSASREHRECPALAVIWIEFELVRLCRCSRCSFSQHHLLGAARAWTLSRACFGRRCCRCDHLAAVAFCCWPAMPARNDGVLARARTSSSWARFAHLNCRKCAAAVSAVLCAVLRDRMIRDCVLRDCVLHDYALCAGYEPRHRHRSASPTLGQVINIRMTYV